jgi:hypothetical protein
MARARACPRSRHHGASESQQRETYLIPGPAAEQGIRAASVLLQIRPRVVVDLGTGPGVIGQRAGLVFEQARRIGVEVREQERGASRHYDQWIRADYLAPGFRAPRADLVVSNPGFSITVGTVEFALDSILCPGGYMLLFARKTWGESAAAADLIMRRPPLHHWLVHRRLAMSMEDEGTDNCCHVWWVWRCGDDPRRSEWRSRLLPPLPGSWCDWTVRPGDEESVDPLPREFWPEP